MGVVAEASGMKAYLGGALEGPVAARACLQFGAATPALTFGCEMSGQFLLESDLGPRIPFEGGCLVVGQGPGLDIELDTEAVSAHEIARFTVTG
jgi:muconate cycloisomerase